MKVEVVEPGEAGTVGSRMVVLSGMSGAGKTSGLHALEDVGFFAVDNLPPSLWPPLARHPRLAQGRVAVCADVRTGAFLDELQAALDDLAAHGLPPTIVFLTASDQTLVKRYNLTRRTHPLGEGTLSSDIAAERRLLEELRNRAHRVLDTTEMSAKELATQLQRMFIEERSFRLRLVSFGFKRGAPIDADLVLDVRGLPNPYYEESLRSLPGTEGDVQNFVFTPAGLELYTQLRNTIRSLVNLARDAGRSSYTVALGCTGGQHRSVAVVEKLARDLAERFEAQLEHRDLEAALEEGRE